MNLLDSSGWLEYFADGPKLPLADSIILAAAQVYEAVIWTQDAHFKGKQLVKYFAK